MMQPDHFDREKHFYPIVMGYLVQLAGFKELALRGLKRADSYKNAFEEVRKVDLETPGLKELITGIKKLAAPLELRSEALGTHIQVDVDLVAHEIVESHPYLLSFINQNASFALVLAHEIGCKKKVWNDNGPSLEFLRHCRNAAGHGGRFSLKNGEPRRLASWRGLSITAESNDSHLFKQPGQAGLLSPGDPIRLLWDIEQTYPMEAVSAA